jgi:hypothetical protein
MLQESSAIIPMARLVTTFPPRYLETWFELDQVARGLDSCVLDDDGVMEPLNGHEAGNGGHSQGAFCTPPRRSPTRLASHV